MNGLRAWTLAVATLALATNVHAAGINLSWDECGVYGNQNKAFACNTNTGAALALYGSFVSPGGTTAITGVEAILDFGSINGPLPSWWAYKNAGACRQSAASASANFTGGPFSCADYYAGQAAGGLAWYTMSYGGNPCRARMGILFAVPATLAIPMDPDVEFYAFALFLSRTMTVGTGACAGCLDPVAIVLNEVKLTQPVGVGDFRLQNPNDRNFVSWQGGEPWRSCLWVPVRNNTWGSLKSLYQ